MSASLGKSFDFNSKLLRGSNVFGRCFRSFAIKGPAMRVKFGTNC